MPAALKKASLDELYSLRGDLDHSQVDERVAVMLNSILQLESQGEGRESATKALLMVGYFSDGISNQEQTRWLSWNIDECLREFDLEGNPGLNNTTEYCAAEIPIPTRTTIRTGGHPAAKLYPSYGFNKRRRRTRTSAS